MKREVFDCDSCKEEDVECVSLNVYIGSTFNGMDHDPSYTEHDLCIKCCGKFLNLMFDQDDAQPNREALRKLGIPVTSQYLQIN